MSQQQQIIKNAIIGIIFTRQMLPDKYFQKAPKIALKSQKDSLKMLNYKLDHDLLDAILKRYSPTITLQFQTTNDLLLERWIIKSNKLNEILIDLKYKNVTNNKYNRARLEYVNYAHQTAINKACTQIIKELPQYNIDYSNSEISVEITYGDETPSNYIPPSLLISSKGIFTLSISFLYILLIYI